MPRQRSEKAAESEQKVLEALAGLESGLYKTQYQAVKATGTSSSILSWRIQGGKLHSEARESQQLLSIA